MSDRSARSQMTGIRSGYLARMRLARHQLGLACNAELQRSKGAAADDWHAMTEHALCFRLALLCECQRSLRASVRAKGVLISK